MSSRLSQANILIPGVQQLKCPLCYEARWWRVKGLTHLGRRRLVQDIEQRFACIFSGDLRCADTGKPYEPQLCWDDLDSRWVSQYLEVHPSRHGPRRYCTRTFQTLERQRQIDWYLQCTVATYAGLVQSLALEHGHPTFHP